MALDLNKIVRTSTAHAGWAKLVVATIRLPNGRTIAREIEDHGSAVCVLPYNPFRRTAVLVRQFRAPVLYAAGEQDTLEAIAGILEESDPAECARRETMEEVGLKLDSLERLLTGWTMPGLSTERMHFFLATYSGTPSRDTRAATCEEESILSVELTLPQLAEMADHQGIVDVETLLLIQTLRLRKPSLFAT